jgi:MFS family permease
MADDTLRGRDRLHFLFLNIGHFLDHLMMLVYATVAALALSREWGMSYAELVPYATPGFIAFGVFSLPAGWLADKWSRHGMMAVFFIGIGIASIATAFARTPFEIGFWLFVVGVLAAIYHPVGLAMVVQQYAKAGMAIGINGIWGNLGVGSAALLTGFFIDNGGWRTAFIVPGVVSIVAGALYTYYFWDDIRAPAHRKPAAAASVAPGASDRALRDALIRLSVILFFTLTVSSIIFQSTTFALPKVFDERLTGIAGSATLIGWLAFLVFACASLAQLVVGSLLDRIGPRPVFIGAALVQMVFFAAMPGLSNWAALIVALGFMLGAFGQIPINDYMIGKMARSELRASVYGLRYLVSFVALASAIPLIAWVHETWGFDVLFYLLSASAAVILVAVSLLPAKLPEATPAARPEAAKGAGRDAESGTPPYTRGTIRGSPGRLRCKSADRGIR